MTVKKNILVRVSIIGIICALFGFATIAKVYVVQTSRDGHWRSMADSLTTKSFKIPAERGNIYSSENELLATTLPFFDLYVDFGSSAMTDELFKKNVDSLAYYLSAFKKYKSVQSYKKELTIARKLKRRGYAIGRNIDYAQLKKIKNWPLFREGKYKGGLVVDTKQQRYNPYGYLAERTIGYTREDGVDVGLEKTYNNFLEGIGGQMLKQRIAGGTWMPIKNSESIEPKKGKDIHTTIDISVQDIAESTLMDAVKSYNADFACAVVMEVKTGAIKAIANLGKTKNGEYAEIYNYAVGIRNEPGSVFKLAGYLSLFDDGFITLNDSINTNYASFTIGKFKLTDDGHNTQYEYLKPAKALAISSNVAIAKWLVQFYSSNKKKFYSKLAQFGLTTRTNIEIDGEPEPLIKNPDSWSIYTLPWMAHGYELKLTPMQILTFYNAVANKGIRMQPHIVSEISENGSTYEKILKSKGTKICSPQAALYATEILKAVIDDPNGTGRGIKTPHYEIAGKSGTAKMSFGKEGYTNKNLSTFVGFFPADNPLYSCIVVLGNPQGVVTTGGYVAGPVFRTIADKIITSNVKNNVAINKDTSLLIQSPPAFITSTQQIKPIIKLFGLKTETKQFDSDFAYVQVLPKDNRVQIRTIKHKENVVPNVRGMVIDDAVYLLENMGLNVGFSGTGKVQSQSIEAGSNLIKGSYIYLNLN